jgi:hypothetical protein
LDPSHRPDSCVTWLIAPTSFRPVMGDSGGQPSLPLSTGSQVYSTAPFISSPPRLFGVRIAPQCSAVRCSAVQCSTVHHNTTQHCTVQCRVLHGTMQCSPVQHTVQYSTTVQCSACCMVAPGAAWGGLCECMRKGSATFHLVVHYGWYGAVCHGPVQSKTLQYCKVLGGAECVGWLVSSFGLGGGEGGTGGDGGGQQGDRRR